MNNWNPSFDSVQEVCSPGARGSAYIVLPNEYGTSDQTDINRTVFLDPLGRWSRIRDVDPDWALQEGGRSGP